MVQTMIRLLLEEQSDQGVHCLQFSLHVFEALPYGIYIKDMFAFNFSVINRNNYLWCPKKKENYGL